MPSHNLSKIDAAGLELIGYSIAGEETVVGIPQLDVCFDIGKSPDQLISIGHLLLTHGHMDHAAGIAYYLSHRKFCGQAPGVVLAPEITIEPIKQIINAWGKLDGNQIPAKLIATKPGDEYKIKPNLFARAFATSHSRGSLGFAVIEKKRKLKQQYLGLSSPKIVELKKQGVTIDYEVETPIVAYLGDTQYNKRFAKLDFVAKSRVLIAECTFVDDEHTDRALAGKHMHIDDFVRMINEFDNDHIIVTHLSQRTFIGEAKKILKKKLTKQQYEKMTILMDRRRNDS